MAKSKVINRIAVAALLGLCFLASNTYAQTEQAISDAILFEPWRLEHAVVRSLPTALAAIQDADQRAEINRQLDTLAGETATLQAKMEDVALLIVANPGVVYRTDEISKDLADKIGKLGQALAALHKKLKLENRSDVVAAQTSLDELRKILLQKTAFDRDVGGAVASGSKNQIQALAGRWWNGAERIGELKVAIKELRGTK